MSAWSADIKIEQGATFQLGFVYYNPKLNVDGSVAQPIAADTDNPKDLTDCTARMQIKKAVKDTTAAITATSEEVPTDPDADPALTARAGRIVLGGDTGRIDIILTDADTDAIDFVKGVYDLEIEHSLEEIGGLRPFVERILEGAVTIDPNVTKVDT